METPILAEEYIISGPMIIYEDTYFGKGRYRRTVLKTLCQGLFDLSLKLYLLFLQKEVKFEDKVC